VDIVYVWGQSWIAMAKTQCCVRLLRVRKAYGQFPLIFVTGESRVHAISLPSDRAVSVR
jgi:hypothetical protein